MSHIEVSAEHPYQVVIGAGVADQLPDLVADAARVAFIHAGDLAEWTDKLADSIAGEAITIEVPNAEKAKTTAVLDGCWRLLAEHGFTRSDVIVGVGGGATTDLAGFVAATYLRGIRYVSMPTSLLAMVDAAVGGKTGINLREGKNLVGAFYEPVAVLADVSVLATLPPAETISGLAEVVKAGFISDPTILSLVANPDVLCPASATQLAAIDRSVAVKAAVVSSDLRERTSVSGDIGRELLNYGHTLGHAIERVENYRLRHGEAISIGMVLAAELALELGLATGDFVQQHRQILSSLGLPTGYHGNWEELRNAMNLDKKTRGSALRFILLSEVAIPHVVVAPDEAALAAAFARLAPLD